MLFLYFDSTCSYNKKHYLVNHPVPFPCTQAHSVSPEELSQLEEIIEKDPLNDLTDQEKTLMWTLRCSLNLCFSTFSVVWHISYAFFSSMYFQYALCEGHLNDIMHVIMTFTTPLYFLHRFLSRLKNMRRQIM